MVVDGLLDSVDIEELKKSGHSEKFEESVKSGVFFLPPENPIKREASQEIEDAGSFDVMLRDLLDVRNNRVSLFIFVLLQEAENEV